MTKILKLSLVSLVIFQLWTAASFELAHDEAYYWLYSQHLDWGYFDHPPMVGVIIRLFSFLPHSELSVRIGFIILQFLACLILLKMTSKDKRALTLSLFFAFPLASFSGLLALPDLPLLFFTTLYFYFLKEFLESSSKGSVIGLSAAIPLLLYSKYHGILVVFFTLVGVPGLLKRREFYLIAAASLLLFLPHVWWQHEHDYSTLRYHFFERPKSDFSLKRLVDYSLTQIILAGVFVGPLVWWLALKTKPQSSFERALKSVSIGTFIFFFFSTLSKKFEANWTVFLTAPLILLSIRSHLWEKPWAKKALAASLAIVLGARVLFSFEPSTLKIKRLQEFHGWEKWAKEIDERCELPILANTYQVASKLSFYLNKPIHSLNYHSRKNQFDYWLRDPQYYPTTEVCYITDKREFQGNVLMSPEGKDFRLLLRMDTSEVPADSP